MRRFTISLLVLVMIAATSAGCSSSRKEYTQLRGLMLLDNTQLGKNRTYYSKHKAKRAKDYRKKFGKGRNY